MKKMTILLAILIFVVASFCYAGTWTVDHDTPIASTTIAATEDIDHYVVFGTVAFTATNTAESAVLTSMSTLDGLYVGMPVVFEGVTSTIASIDSGTQITLADTVTDVNNDGAGIGTCSYTSVLLQFTMTFEVATDGAVIEMYTTSDGTTWDTTPFYTNTILDAQAGVAYNFSTRIYKQSYPTVKTVISNPAAESGTEDDITVTVKFAGYL